MNVYEWDDWTLFFSNESQPFLCILYTNLPKTHRIPKRAFVVKREIRMFCIRMEFIIFWIRVFWFNVLYIFFNHFCYIVCYEDAGWRDIISTCIPIILNKIYFCIMITNKSGVHSIELNNIYFWNCCEYFKAKSNENLRILYSECHEFRIRLYQKW